MRVLMLPAAAAILLIGADLLCAPAVNAQVQSPSPSATDQPSPSHRTYLMCSVGALGLPGVIMEASPWLTILSG
jgi:hypothetical protein